MKKILIISCLFIIVFLVLIIVSKDEQQYANIVFVDSFEYEPVQSIKACVKRSDGKLVLIDVNKDNSEDIYLYVLKLYDHYRNSLPLTYTTPLKGNYEIIQIKKTNDKLLIELRVLYIGDEFSSFLTALMWTYQGLGINSIEIKVNNEIFHLKKDDSINLEYASIGGLLPSTKQIIFYENDKEILPVTYYHNENPIDFLMNKVLTRYLEISYQYEVIDKMIILNINDPQYELNSEVINALMQNISNLKLYEDIIIIKNEQIVSNN